MGWGKADQLNEDQEGLGKSRLRTRGQNWQVR